MSKKQRILKNVGALFLSIGIFLGFFLTSIMVWGDLEASLFTSGIRAEKTLSTLKCPIVITASETGYITAELNNPTSKTIERYLIANISEGYASLVREIRTNLPIPPEEKKKVEWKIYPEDAAYNERVILFRVYINPRYPHPSLGANCGVVRINVDRITGSQIVASASFLALASIGSGAVLIELSGRRTKNHSRSAITNGYALAGVVIGAAIVSYMGIWVMGISILAVALIIVVILVTRKLMG